MMPGRFHPGAISETAWRWFQRQKARVDPDVVFRLLGAVVGTDLAAELPGLRPPLLLLHPDGSPLIPVSLMAALRDLVARSRLHAIGRARATGRRSRMRTCAWRSGGVRGRARNVTGIATETVLNLGEEQNLLTTMNVLPSPRARPAAVPPPCLGRSPSACRRFGLRRRGIPLIDNPLLGLDLPETSDGSVLRVEGLNPPPPRAVGGDCLYPISSAAGDDRIIDYGPCPELDTPVPAFSAR